MADNTYRLIIFDLPDDVQPLREVFRSVLGLHPTEAMQWIRRAPGILPYPLPEGEVRELLDALYEQRVPAEARRIDSVPKLFPARSVHKADCLEQGLRIGGLYGEPAHWIPWEHLELVHVGRIMPEEDQPTAAIRGKGDGAVAAALNAMVLRKPGSPRLRRPSRTPKEPTTELHLVRNEPLIAFRVVTDQMNYSYLEDRLAQSTVENFPIFLGDIVKRARNAYITPSAQLVLKEPNDQEPDLFPTSRTMLDNSTLQLLRAWYRRDRDADTNATAEH